MTAFKLRDAKDILLECPEAPAAEGADRFSAYRKRLLEILENAGMTFPAARDMSEADLEACPPHHLMIWLDEIDLGEVHLYQIPDDQLTDGLRAAFAIAEEFGPDQQASSDAAWAASVRVANAINQGVVPLDAYDLFLGEVSGEAVCPSPDDLTAEAGCIRKYHSGRFGAEGGAGLSDALLNTRIVGTLVFSTYS